MADSTDSPRIVCAADGPYLVKNLERLENSRGEPLATKPTVALCRCGGSASKPFCDGTHRKNGFTSARQRAEAPTRAWEEFAGADITILDNRTVCAHAGACTDGLPAVFRLGQEPWIEPSGADAAAVRATVGRCPSGALAHAAAGEEPAREAAGSAAITVSKDGPYWVVGLPALEDEVTGQTPQNPAKFALCRCGQSRNKPFCDGAHWNAGFHDEQN